MSLKDLEVERLKDWFWEKEREQDTLRHKIIGTYWHVFGTYYK